jgi:hypothetical protein
MTGTDRRQIEPPAWMGDIIVTTRWHHGHESEDDENPGAYFAVGMKMYGKQVRCHECGETINFGAVAGVVQVGSPEDPGITQFHLICDTCAPHHHRAMALGHAWVAEKIEDAQRPAEAAE